MDKYSRTLQAVREHPWAIVPSMLEAIIEIVETRAAGQRWTPEEIKARIGAEDEPRPRGVMRVGSVAVLALHGVMAQRMNLFMEISGGTSTEIFGRWFDEAIADPDVSAVVLSIDSPGGSVYGTEELAQKIYRSRPRKPIVAVADSLAASAAYHVGSQAHEFVITPSGQVGSIGVVTTHRDVSKAEELAGVKTTVLAIPPAKVEGHPYAPLSEETQQNILGQMQPFYDLFVKAVARGRGVTPKDVREGYGRGRVLAAVPALEAGMVDRIESLADTISRLSSPQGRRVVMQAKTTDQEPSQATSQESRGDLWQELLQVELDTL